MKRTVYLWSTLAIELICQDGTQAQKLDALWQKFFYLLPVTSPEPASRVLFHLQAEPQEQTQANRKRVWHRGDSSAWQTAAGLCLQLGATQLDVDSKGGCAGCYIAPEFWSYALAEQRDFFMRGLLLLFRSKGLYGLHANGVLKDEAGMLVVGPSGHGKTTLTLSLVQAGWRYLGDDVTVLRSNADAVEALALQQGFACTTQTTQLLPNLSAGGSLQLDTVRHKRWLPCDDQQAAQLAPVCSPRLLLFPTIVEAAESRLKPLNETQTLLGLMEQSAALFIEAGAAAQQMAMLQQLTRQTRSYQLLTGRDVYTNPPAVAARLGEMLKG